jgi:hypothetical protein
MSLFLKQVTPLQAGVSRKVEVLATKETFSNGIESLNRPEKQVCTETKPDCFFESLPHHSVLFDMAVRSIRTMLKCFQAEFGDSILDDPNSHLRRAIWSVDV